jgi:hypothetical protein
MFADLLFDMGDVIHVGLPTNADTQYTYVRDQKLETDNAVLKMPNAVFRRRRRAVNQTYVPKHVTTIDISDTYALEQWILELPELQKRPKMAAGDASSDASARRSPLVDPPRARNRGRKR